jgi:hypothetical protein
MVGFFIAGMLATPFLAGESIADSAAVLTNLTKNDVRVELQANLSFSDKEQNGDVWRVYETVYMEFLRNGWRNDASGKYVGAVTLEHEARMKRNVVHLRVRVRDVCTEPLFTTVKAGSADWEGQTVRITENCIVDSGYWK